MTRGVLALTALFFTGCGVGSESDALESPDASSQSEAGPDAGAVDAECGDGVCEGGESCSNCEADCGACADCGSDGETEPSGVDYATEIQPIFDTRCTGCHGSSGGLSLSSYDGAVAGGSNGPGVDPCDCENSIIYQKISPNPPFGDRMPDNGPPYLNETEQQLICDWINQGAGETYDPNACGGADAPPPPDDDECSDDCGDGTCSADEDCESCPGDCGECEGDADDVTPPQFAGLVEVDELSGSACEVRFQAAADDVTPSQDIVYDVYAGPRGNVDLSEPIDTLDNSELSVDDDELVGTVSLPAGDRYDLIVRARDAAGNSDDNTEEDDCDLR